MDFFKSAVASAISSGSPLPGYTFGDQVDIERSIWTVYNATRREDGSNCSIFDFPIASNKSLLPIAKNALKKLRTLRHPGVLKVLDTLDTETHIYIATERVSSLKWQIKRKSMSIETLKWGLYSIAQTIKFINDEASSVHGNLRVGSIYTSESGEWKLGGFEILSNLKDDEAIIYNYGSLVPDSGLYAAPELARSGWDAIKRGPVSAVDSYNFGTLIYEVFNGEFRSSNQAGQTKNIPANMHSSYKRLVSANPKVRLSVGNFLEQGRRVGGFFETPLIKLTENVDNLGMKSEDERAEFLNDLDGLADDFPETYFRMKILPELLKSVEFGGGGPQVFAVVMKIAAKLTDEDFDAKVTPVVVRLFNSPDRAIRVCLLDNLPLMINRLPQKIVNDKIFPQMVTGFTDVAPLVREQTVKAVLTVITKLSDRTINGELLKYLAKTSNDEQPGIRTNTTICLGRIAKNLGVSTRSKVLIAAFTRSLRDPFVHARNASMMALGATVDVFSDDDCAQRILPSLCPLLVDKEKLVRDSANKTFDAYLTRIRKLAKTLPDTVLPPPSEANPAGNGSTPRMSTPQTEAASWTGWAISSFTNKISAATGDITSSNSNGSAEDRPSSAPPNPPAPVLRPSNPSVSALHRQAVTSPSISTRTSLSSNAANPHDFFDSTPGLEDENIEAWGDMDDDFDDNTDGNKSTTITTSKILAGGAKKPAITKSRPPPANVSAANPFGIEDDGEPDFAGWLAASSAKKVGGKPLPKGLAAKPERPSIPARTATTMSLPARTATPGNLWTSKAAGAATKAKPTASAAAKKIDTKPKAIEDDDWDNGW